MPSTQIKICGITRVEDASAIADSGVDAVGLVFYRYSSRSVDCARAREIVATLRPFTSAVALFLDPTQEEVEEVLTNVPVDVLQFHGREPARFCESFGRRWIKAAGMAGDADITAIAAAYPGAAGMLVDAHPPGAAGGTGVSFDWERLPSEREFRLVLAGGLHAGNVADGIRRVRPDAVDVSSGVERTKGCKDAQLVREFIEEVRRGDRNTYSGHN